MQYQTSHVLKVACDQWIEREREGDRERGWEREGEGEKERERVREGERDNVYLKA